ncbi:MAG: N-acyl-D-amino-acid deacylase [Lysobacterales bacterium]|jgi:N-acyl-D-amino-acid deacylase
MKFFRIFSVSGITLLALAACTIVDLVDLKERSNLTIVLVGGTVYSGENTEPFIADVWIKGDRIVGLGQLGNAPADLVLDVRGLAVVPGFIDLHSHAIRDNPEQSGIFRWPDAENQIRQGVTSIIGGPDGGSPVPLTESFSKLEESPASVNYGSMIGHGSVRAEVVGLDDRPATSDEMQAMRELVDAAMREGAFGLSSGLVYTPGSFADTEEIIELAKVAGKYNGIYISHIRDENLGVLESVAELIRIAEEGGLPGQITHAKVMGTAMQGRSVDMLKMVDEAIARGVDISLDQYPYTAGRTSLMVQFPRWSKDGGSAMLAERLKNEEMRVRIKQELIYQISSIRGRNDPANVQLSICDFDHSLDGLNLTQIMEQRSMVVSIANAAELLIEFQLAGGCQAIYHAMHPEDVITILQHPRTMIASDGGIEVPGNAHPHPRNYGTYSRVLGHYARDLGVIPVHTAIHKMTVMPAERIGLENRGRIAPGMIADIAILNMDMVMDRSNFIDPHQYSEGAVHVFVAGEAVLLNGQMTGSRPGRVLRSSSYEGDQ